MEMEKRHSPIIMIEKETIELIWHYTHGQYLEKILESGELRVSEAESKLKVKPPALWLSKNPIWENTATKDVKTPEGVRRMTKKEMHEKCGLFRFAAIWEKKSSNPWEARHNLTSDEYQKTFNEMVAKGYVPINVCGYSINGDARFAAVWEKKSSNPWEARHNLTADEYQRTFAQLLSKGYVLAKISGYAVHGEARFAAIWEKKSSPSWEARHNLTSEEYQKTFEQLVTNGYSLKSVCGYDVNGDVRFAATWSK